jgi:hypothetical protein
MYDIQTLMSSYMNRVHARDSTHRKTTNYEAFVYTPQNMYSFHYMLNLDNDMMNIGCACVGRIGSLTPAQLNMAQT